MTPANDGHCHAPDCPNPARVAISNGCLHTRKWCSKHAKQRETAAARAKGNTCIVPECTRPVSQSRSLCAAHLTRLRTHGDVMEGVPIALAVRIQGDACQVEGCERQRNGKRLCPAHAWRAQFYGGQTFPEVPIPAEKGALRAAADAPATANVLPELVSVT
jgi:hypothetical protein